MSDEHYCFVVFSSTEEVVTMKNPSKEDRVFCYTVRRKAFPFSNDLPNHSLHTTTTLTQ